MGYVLKTNLAHPKNYGGKRLTDIKFIAIHYTSNDGDTAKRNAEYFHGTVVKASAHYFVDDNTVYRTVPDNCVAWAVGGSKYSDCSKTGGGKLYKVATNANTISIELCDTVKDGKVMATEQTLANAAELCRKLMTEYHIDVDHVIRHFDVNGKHCPAYFMNENKWNNWKKRLVDCDNDEENPNVSKVPFMIRVHIDDLNFRSEPSMDGKVMGQTEKGSFTIVEVKDGWGLLKSCADERDGWVWLGNPEYCTPIT